MLQGRAVSLHHLLRATLGVVVPCNDTLRGITGNMGARATEGSTRGIEVMLFYDLRLPEAVVDRADHTTEAVRFGYRRTTSQLGRNRPQDGVHRDRRARDVTCQRVGDVFSAPIGSAMRNEAAETIVLPGLLQAVRIDQSGLFASPRIELDLNFLTFGVEDAFEEMRLFVETGVSVKALCAASDTVLAARDSRGFSRAEARASRRSFRASVFTRPSLSASEYRARGSA